VPRSRHEASVATPFGRCYKEGERKPAISEAAPGREEESSRGGTNGHARDPVPRQGTIQAGDQVLLDVPVTRSGIPGLKMIVSDEHIQALQRANIEFVDITKRVGPHRSTPVQP
jgi:hypothetical protein